MNRWFACVAFSCLLAGCSQTSVKQGAAGALGGDAGEGELAADSMEIRGHVFGPSLNPLAGANVTLVALREERITDPSGAFDFGTRPRGLYTLHAEAAAHISLNYTVAPEAGGLVSLVLEAGRPIVPYSDTVAFAGLLQCALEVAIISPSCDSAVVYVDEQYLGGHGIRLFDEAQSFLVDAGLGWQTLVVDVVFDGEAHPGLAGLRATIRGNRDPENGGEYTQYGRWNSPDSFTIRLEPGGAYPEGTEPVPVDSSRFEVDVYPHSHGYQQVCSPTACFLGLGAAVNVEFDVYATVFYVEPAPSGWTLREANP